MRANANTRPQGNPTIHQLVTDAMRAAAIARSPNDAIDVLGAALIALEKIVRGEVRHA